MHLFVYTYAYHIALDIFVILITLILINSSLLIYKFTGSRNKVQPALYCMIDLLLLFLNEHGITHLILMCYSCWDAKKKDDKRT